MPDSPGPSSIASNSTVLNSNKATSYILAIDQGTTGTTAALVDQSGQIVAHCNQEFKQHFPQPSWVEHRLEDIWSSVRETVSAVLKTHDIDRSQIAAIGITNQRETVGFWDRKTGRSSGPAIVWQDRRTADRCQVLKDAGHQKMIHTKTGLYLDPYFSASKIEWLSKHNTDISAGLSANKLVCGTIDSYLISMLSGGARHVSDLSNASRTLLLDIHTGEWDDDLLALFGIAKNILPSIVVNAKEIAKTKGLDFLPDGIPITGVAGDQQAALFGQGCTQRGEAKCTYGTGAFALVHAGEQAVIPENGLLATIGWQLSTDLPVNYCIEGSTFIAGAAVQWLRDGLGIIDDASKIEDLAREVTSSAGVVVVPALAGLAAPYWDPGATGAILGITRGTTRAHIARATLEGIALRVSELLNCIQSELDAPLSTLKVDGGAAKNNLLMQYQADFSGLTVCRPKDIESTVLGAAYLAGIGLDWWTINSLPINHGTCDTNANDLGANRFNSTLPDHERRRRLDDWRAVVKRVLSTHSPDVETKTQ